MGRTVVCDNCSGAGMVYSNKTKKMETCTACNGKGHKNIGTI